LTAEGEAVLWEREGTKHLSGLNGEGQATGRRKKQDPFLKHDILQGKRFRREKSLYVEKTGTF